MIRIDGVKFDLHYGEEELSMAASRILKVKPGDITSVSLAKRSLDARDKQNIHFVASLHVEIDDENAVLKRCHNRKVYRENASRYRVPSPRYTGMERPIVVGTGPAGLFGALVLAESGLCPLVLEAGKMAEERREDVANFCGGGPLLPDSNIQFGEGGAGTFSDGKLTTGTRDPRHHYILNAFVTAGAPAEITWQAKPHIGSDYLWRVVGNLRKRIEALGGEFCFQAKLTNILVSNHRLRGIVIDTPQGEREIACDRLLLAIGHSARQTYAMLNRCGVAMEPKNFAVGVRIEHLREDIDGSQYGRTLPTGAADYKLAAHLRSGRGVYTFCMCPGGVVVPAASEVGVVVTNGMSNFARNAVNSNSALLVNVKPADFGEKGPLAGITFQRNIERAAFQMDGSYRAPVQTVGDFMRDKPSSTWGRVEPSYLPGAYGANVAHCLPDFVAASIREALPLFESKLRGFAAEDALLIAAETRSSAPLRLLRNDMHESHTVRGVFPAGEGAGYAGGIMSSAADGMRVAESILHYKG